MVGDGVVPQWAYVTRNLKHVGTRQRAKDRRLSSSFFPSHEFRLSSSTIKFFFRVRKPIIIILFYFFLLLLRDRRRHRHRSFEFSVAIERFFFLSIVYENVITVAIIGRSYCCGGFAGRS